MLVKEKIDLKDIERKATAMVTLFEEDAKDAFWTHSITAMLEIMLIIKYRENKKAISQILNDIGAKPREWVDLQVNKLKCDVSLSEEEKAQYLDLFKDFVFGMSDKMLAEIILDIRYHFEQIVVDLRFC